MRGVASSLPQEGWLYVSMHPLLRNCVGHRPRRPINSKLSWSAPPGLGTLDTQSTTYSCYVPLFRRGYATLSAGLRVCTPGFKNRLTGRIPPMQFCLDPRRPFPHHFSQVSLLPPRTTWRYDVSLISDWLSPERYDLSTFLSIGVKTPGCAHFPRAVVKCVTSCNSVAQCLA